MNQIIKANRSARHARADRPKKKGKREANKAARRAAKFEVRS